MKCITATQWLWCTAIELLWWVYSCSEIWSFGNSNMFFLETINYSYSQVTNITRRFCPKWKRNICLIKRDMNPNLSPLQLKGVTFLSRLNDWWVQWSFVWCHFSIFHKTVKSSHIVTTDAVLIHRMTFSLCMCK